MKIEWKYCFRVGISAFILFLCITYWSSFTKFLGNLIGASTPLILGCVIAYIVNILMSFYEKHYFPKAKKKIFIKSRRPMCMILAFVSLAVVVIVLVRLVIPELLASAALLISHIPPLINSMISWLEENGIVPDDLLNALKSIDWKSRIEQIISVLTTGVGNILGVAVNMISSVFSGAVTALFAVIFSIYLLIDKEKMGKQFDRVMKRYMKDNLYDKIINVLSVLNDCFHKYIVSQCAEALILGGLCTVGMWIFNFPYATMTGAVIAFTALIPVAGGYIGAAIGAFVIFTVSPMKALLFLIYIVILQQLENNLIYPKVVGSSIGLPAIWVLASATVGGGLFGIVGMLIGVPLASAMYRLIHDDLNRRKIEIAQ